MKVLRPVTKSSILGWVLLKEVASGLLQIMPGQEEKASFLEKFQANIRINKKLDGGPFVPTPVVANNLGNLLKTLRPLIPFCSDFKLFDDQNKIIFDSVVDTIRTPPTRHHQQEPFSQSLRTFVGFKFSGHDVDLGILFSPVFSADFDIAGELRKYRTLAINSNGKLVDYPHIYSVHKYFVPFAQDMQRCFGNGFHSDFSPTNNSHLVIKKTSQVQLMNSESLSDWIDVENTFENLRKLISLGSGTIEEELKRGSVYMRKWAQGNMILAETKPERTYEEFQTVFFQAGSSLKQLIKTELAHGSHKQFFTSIDDNDQETFDNADFENLNIGAITIQFPMAMSFGSHDYDARNDMIYFSIRADHNSSKKDSWVPVGKSTFYQLQFKTRS